MFKQVVLTLGILAICGLFATGSVGQTVSSDTADSLVGGECPKRYDSKKCSELTPPPDVEAPECPSYVRGADPQDKGKYGTDRFDTLQTCCTCGSLYRYAWGCTDGDVDIEG